MRKGISSFISAVLLILVTIIAIYLVINVAKPTVERAYEAALINEVEQNMQLLDNLIREVASEGTGSLRSVILKVSDGDYKIIGNSGDFTGALQYQIGLKHSAFSAPMIKKIGNLKFTAGMNSVGLVGYWKFDEGSGEIADDSSGYGNHGTLFNGSSICGNPPTANCPEWVDGKFRRGLSFDGINDYVEVSDSASLDIGTSDMTIELWIKAPLPTKTGGLVIKRDWFVLTNPGYQLQVHTDGRAHFFFCDGTATRITFSSAVIVTDNTWHHLVVVAKRNDKALFYVDAIGRSSISISVQQGSIANTLPLRIGADSRPDVSQFFNGLIDEVRIYNRALSEEEVKENYEAKASNYQAVLEYSKIILTGPLRLGKGTHKLCIEKIGELNNKPLVKITAC